MEIKFYKVDTKIYEYETTYGYFSTYEKAAEFMNQLNELDGFGICKEDLRIEECVLKLDVVDDWVNEFIIRSRMRKKNFERGSQ